MLPKILYLKMVLPCTYVVYFSPFYFQNDLCSFHAEIYTETPRNFIVLTLSISQLFICNVNRKREGVLSWPIYETMKIWFFLHLVTVYLLIVIR